jgi:hypothetical protein
MSTWTPERKLDYLVRMPWTIVPEPADDGEIALRVRELPGSLVIGTAEELDTLYWENLRATLASLLHFGDEIPRPRFSPVQWPWNRTAVVEVEDSVSVMASGAVRKHTAIASGPSEAEDLLEAAAA